MSTLKTDNFEELATGDSVGAKYLVHGTAKAWANLNGTGTIALRDSFNVSSVVDNGVGTYRTNLTSSMANASYVGSGSFVWGNNGNQIVVAPISVGSYDTSTLEANAVVDRATVLSIIHGDLA
jgi:hypothetical protein